MIFNVTCANLRLLVLIHTIKYGHVMAFVDYLKSGGKSKYFYFKYLRLVYSRKRYVSKLSAGIYLIRY